MKDKRKRWKSFNFHLEQYRLESASFLFLVRYDEADGMPLTLTRLLGLQLWFEIPIWNIKELFNCRNSSLVS